MSVDKRNTSGADETQTSTAESQIAAANKRFHQIKLEADSRKAEGVVFYYYRSVRNVTSGVRITRNTHNVKKQGSLVS